MSEARYIPWEQITKGCYSLVLNCTETLKDVDVVVGLSNDMVVPIIISNLLKLPVVPVIKTNILDKDIDNLISIDRPLMSGQGKLPPQPKLLVAASKSHTGDKVEQIIETYKARGHEVIHYAMFYCDDLGIPPDLYWHRANECNSKLIFPWEL